MCVQTVWMRQTEDAGLGCAMFGHHPVTLIVSSTSERCTISSTQSQTSTLANPRLNSLRVIISKIDFASITRAGLAPLMYKCDYFICFLIQGGRSGPTGAATGWLAGWLAGWQAGWLVFCTSYYAPHVGCWLAAVESRVAT